MSGAAVDPMGNVTMGGAPEAAMPPTEDEFFGALPSEDEFFGHRAPRHMPQGAELAGLMPQEPEDVASGGARVLTAFGQGAAHGWGATHGKVSAGIEAGLEWAGVIKAADESQANILQSFNGQILRPAATAIDWAISAGLGVVMGATSGALAGVEAVAGRDAAAMADWYLVTGNAVGGAGIPPVIGAPVRGVLYGLSAASRFRIPPPVAQALPVTSYGRFDEAFARWDAAKAAREGMVAEGERARDLGRDLYEAYAEGVIGRGERGYSGLDDGLPGGRMERGAPQAELLPQAPARPADVHAAARELAPDVFAEYDMLAARRDDLRGQIADAQAAAAKEADAQNPMAAQIAAWQARLDAMTPRMREKYGPDLEARIAAAREGFADQAAMLTRDTPEIAAMRRDLMEADYRMRDLSPEVSAAYREAAKDFPDVAERAPEPAAAVPDVVAAPEAVAEAVRPVDTPAPVEPATAAPEASRAMEPAAVGEPARTTQGDAVAPAQPRAPINIAEDVAARLRAAGRPADEAAASAAVVDAYWTTRAAHLGEDAGELYRRFGSDILAGGEGGRAGLGQGKIKLPAAMELAQTGAVQTDTIPHILDREGIKYTVQYSKSNTERHGPSLSAYYKIETPNGVKKIRVSDHNYPGVYDLDIHLGSNVDVATAEILELAGKKIGRASCRERV